MERERSITVWRIRDVYPGSRIQLFSIPDPGSELSPSRIPDPGSSSKNLSILTPWFLSSKKYDPGCSSRIPDPDADFLPSRIQGSKRHPIPDPGSGSTKLVNLWRQLARESTPGFHPSSEPLERPKARERGHSAGRATDLETI
jgi:hypothetical protein